MMEAILKEQYGIESALSPIGNGHINTTFVTSDGLYIVQRINTSVFRDPAALMANVTAVTAHLKKKLEDEGKDPERGTLTVVPARSGENFVRDTDCAVYRVCKNIRHTRTVEPGEQTASEMLQAGRIIGRWEAMLSDFPAASLYETIPDFHHTVKRAAHFERAVKEDRAGRLSSALREAEEMRKREGIASVVLSGIQDGSIPLSVTHNDTKINNILFEENSDTALSLIDLDTIMPGSRLYDFGEAMRTGAFTGAEDDPDLSAIRFIPEQYEAFREGYLEAVGDVLTLREKELLLFSVLLMTYENGIRFLTDYLEGDVYFQCSRPEHNLDRARTQLRRVELLEELLGKRC